MESFLWPEWSSVELLQQMPWRRRALVYYSWPWDSQRECESQECYLYFCCKARWSWWVSRGILWLDVKPYWFFCFLLLP
jgi:hypothetical protein